MTIGSVYYQTSDWQEMRWQDLKCLLEVSGIDSGKPVSLLDLGCGSGCRTLNTLEVFPHLTSVLGVDSDPTMIESASQKSASPEIQYQTLPMEKISSLDKTRSFDVLLAHYSLHWLKDKFSLFQTLNSITHPESILLVGTCEKLPEFLNDIDLFLRENLDFHSSAAPFFYLDLNQWKKLLSGFGWEICSFSQRQDEHIVENPGLAFLEHWFSASAGKAFYGKNWEDVLSEDREKINSLIENLNLKYLNDGKWTFHEETLLFVAKRKKQ